MLDFFDGNILMPVVLGVIINIIMFGAPSACLAAEKGRKVWAAFFLAMLIGFPVLFYYVGVPMSKEKKDAERKKLAKDIAEALYYKR